MASAGVSTIKAALVGATREEVFLGLTKQDTSAIVLIDSAKETGGAFCTGTIVAPNWVLTAGHCVRSSDLRIWMSRENGAHDARRVLRAIRHEEVDAALLQLDADCSVLPTLRLSSEAPELWLNHRVELAGYGMTEGGSVRALNFLVETVTGVASEVIAVDGGDRSGACVGDSGGPLLGRGPTGAIEVLGVLSVGSGTCVGVDHYVRSDVLLPWVRQHTGAAPGGAELCGTVSARGTCALDRAVWCANGELVHQRCSAASVCGWDARAQGFRCVDSERDACGGAGAHGTCDGNDAVVCNEGTVIREACAQRQQRCVYSRSTGEPECGVSQL
jgi:hypothetical protein